jgi:penicillin amidase
MKKAIRALAVAFASVLLLVLILGGLWLWYSHRAFPKTDGTVKVEGLTSPVEVFRDSNGVPHIYAETMEDLFFAQGYVHAQDRFWQMEFWRRIGSGRISELFGESQRNMDIFMRTMGFERVARGEYELLDEEPKKYLEAYAAGVNAYTRARSPARLGLEFALLGLKGVKIEIEPWTPVHSLTWAKLMAYDLGANMYTERLNLDLIRTAGLSGMADYFAPYRDDMPLIVTDEELRLFAGSQIAQSVSSITNWKNKDRPMIERSTSDEPAALPWPSACWNSKRPIVFGNSYELGSNSWVISGSLTATGNPLLANDMHLANQMPSIWYEIGLHCRESSFDVRGFSFAGVPGVIAGHNGRIAWGYTNTAGDVQDFYLERINPENPDQYEANGEWVDMEIIHEEIKIHDEDEPYVLLVRLTRHGPILSDRGSFVALNSYTLSPDTVFPQNLRLYAVSLSWSALHPGRIFKAILGLNRAANFEEFRDALRYWDAPSQNLIYADVDGNIGYQTAGIIPLRKRGFGLVPAPGWTDDYEWIGTVPFNELPVVYNPDKGYIVTANNPIVSRNYPYLLGTSFAYGFRARRITEMIEQDKDGISIDDAKAMHGDTLNLTALEIIPYLEGVSLEVEEEQKPEGQSDRQRKEREKREKEELEALESARERLLEWDGRMDTDSSQAALYSYFWLSLVQETLKDQYPEERWPPDSQGRLQNALHYLLKDPQNPWWDDIRTPDITERRDEILARALRKGYRNGVKELGKKLSSWKWGKIHTVEFRNRTLGESGIILIERIFNRGPFSVRGGPTQVSVTGWSFKKPFKADHIQSMRQIIDLGNLGASLMIHTTGQSGHPGHRHYDDFIDPWRDIQYHPNRWERSEVEADSRNRLVLKPIT